VPSAKNPPASTRPVISNVTHKSKVISPAKPIAVEKAKESLLRAPGNASPTKITTVTPTPDPGNKAQNVVTVFEEVCLASTDSKAKKSKATIFLKVIDDKPSFELRFNGHSFSLAHSIANYQADLTTKSNSECVLKFSLDGDSQAVHYYLAFEDAKTASSFKKAIGFLYRALKLLNAELQSSSPEVGSGPSAFASNIKVEGSQSAITPATKAESGQSAIVSPTKVEGDQSSISPTTNLEIDQSERKPAPPAPKHCVENPTVNNFHESGNLIDFDAPPLPTSNVELLSCLKVDSISVSVYQQDLTVSDHHDKRGQLEVSSGEKPTAPILTIGSQATKLQNDLIDNIPKNMRGVFDDLFQDIVAEINLIGHSDKNAHEIKREIVGNLARKYPRIIASTLKSGYGSSLKTTISQDIGESLSELDICVMLKRLKIETNNGK
jgi:hypothetical protein